MFYIDGRSTDLVANYSVWKVVDQDGALMCAFYGPNSFAAAVNYHKAVTDKKCLLAVDNWLYYEDNRYDGDQNGR